MTNIPEPNFIDRDPQLITQEMIAQFEQMTGKILQPAQVERLIIDMLAYRENLVRIGIQEAAKQNLIEYANYPMLDLLGQFYGVTRLAAQSARTSLRFSVQAAQTFDILIPIGMQVQTKDQKAIFETIDNIVIKAGDIAAEVDAVCTTPGVDGNGYIAGEIKTMMSVIPYVYSAENLSTTHGGADEEDDEGLRARIKEAPEKFSNAGSRGAYRYWTKTAHQDIIDVAVLESAPGVVKVYPLMRTGNPTEEILDLVAGVLNDDKIRPLTDYVMVESPTEVTFEITANVTLYTTADLDTVKAEVNTKLNAYKANMRSLLGRDIVPTKIISIINGVYGVYKVDLSSPSYRKLVENEWAHCTSIIINYTGVEIG